MTVNLGEEIVADFLQHIKVCEFIQQNLYTPDVQGEIDVVGIDLEKKTILICDVAVHLVTDLQYVKDRQPNNVNKLTEKFSSIETLINTPLITQNTLCFGLRDLPPHFVPLSMLVQVV